ncbi:MAG: sodium:alanine symporter family protein [Rikenellaceae bacterium]
MLETIETFIADLSSLLWGWPMIIMLFGCHIFMTIRLKFPQRKLLTGIKLSLSKEEGAEGDVSQFGALVTSLAATIGIGNIVGVATAIALGGPGAVMWCWMSGILGIATKYGEALLAVKYRVKGSDGQMIGGPMYAIERGMGPKWKWLAILFAVFTVLASVGIGSTVQSNAFATVVHDTIGVSKYLSGGLITLAVACVILFGVKGIANVCTKLVPAMTLLYLAGCAYILIANAPFLGESISLIVSSAFTPRAAGGGFVGAAVMTAARFGIARGLFSNESGMGSAPIVAAAAKSRNPVRQALISSTGTFWDTVVICAVTGIVLVSTVVAHPEIESNAGGLLTELAFNKIPYIGSYILMLCLAIFSFSTILGWTYYAEKAVQYLGGTRLIKYFRIIWIAIVFAGAVMEMSLVWNIADVVNVFMALPNIIVLIVLSGVIARETKYYLWENRLNEFSPEDKKEE